LARALNKETRSEFIFQRNKVTTQDTVTYKKGSMRAMQFAQAVGLTNTEALETEK
jgi:hypothetical protein